MAHIKNLFYTFVWNFCPELIIDGYVYAGVPPLYKITTSKGYKYLKNDEELMLYRENNKGKIPEIRTQRGSRQVKCTPSQGHFFLDLNTQIHSFSDSGLHPVVM